MLLVERATKNTPTTEECSGDRRVEEPSHTKSGPRARLNVNDMRLIGDSHGHQVRDRKRTMANYRAPASYLSSIIRSVYVESE